jgi:hypothetical protein
MHKPSLLHSSLWDKKDTMPVLAPSHRTGHITFSLKSLAMAPHYLQRKDQTSYDFLPWPGPLFWPICTQPHVINSMPPLGRKARKPQWQLACDGQREQRHRARPGHQLNNNKWEPWGAGMRLGSGVLRFGKTPWTQALKWERKTVAICGYFCFVVQDSVLLYSPGWPHTWSSCPSLPSAEIIGMHHHT